MKLPFLAVLSLCAAAFAADTAKPAEPVKPATGSEPAKPAETVGEPKVYAPTNLEALKPLKGQKVVLEGKISNTGANKTDSIRYLNFTKNFRESVSLVFFANSGGGTFTKEKLAEFVGKTVRVTGTLSEYNGSLQIRMESLDQLKVIADAPPPPAPATPAK
jgi:hypothetical protein